MNKLMFRFPVMDETPGNGGEGGGGSTGGGTNVDATSSSRQGEGDPSAQTRQDAASTVEGDGGEDVPAPCEHADPCKEVKDVNGEVWVRVYNGAKVIVIKRSLIAALTLSEAEDDPFVHLANAKDVLRLDLQSWTALNAYLFGEIQR